MRTIRAALAAILLSAVQPAVAEVLHIKGVPVPPIQTAEQARVETEKRLSAIKAREAKEASAATQAAGSPSAITPSPLFFTGKPLVEETGQYAFLFRHYDPELNRWTTSDPSGFPDGANNLAYRAVPTNQFDFQGLFTLSTTSPSPSTAYDPTGKYFVEAFTLSHISAGSGMATILAGLIQQYYPTFTASVSSSDYTGAVTVQMYGARNTTRSGQSAGALDLQVILSGASNDFTWIQLVRHRTSSSLGWTHWIVDTTGFGGPSYNRSTDPVLYDLPTIGGWEYQGSVSGASKEFYTFAATRNGNDITIHDAFYWGGVIKE
ncbi:MAG: RHS repeat-associated core domain-containing protein [Terrimicrobiaceae bacterium]|nr:RHS repeat-associated core domain-containing protein [Terrimicrobiaceae bacterium]